MTATAPLPQTTVSLHPVALLAALREQYEDALLSYITDRIPPADWHRAEDLADQTWAYALDHADLSSTTVDEEAGLPEWLAATARIVIRRHLTPATTCDPHWAALTQTLGHAASWPEHWHEVLAAHGQAALLRRAADDLGGDHTSAAPAALAA
ncbi:hypothetical protein [Streptomyces megasporus]|uniref:hypothetical protein n=1 Tax=Streptomyces megasporus TaxID=44060 RepID=UPI0004E0B008|nr:hypothetical protein [Streptomyces megasporus]